MEKFKFHQDVKCTVWVRQFFTIEAENQEDAKRMAMQFQNEDVSDYPEYERQEYLLDTEELMLSDENDGQTTMELWAAGEKEPFATNGSEAEKQVIHRWDEYKNVHQLVERDMAGYHMDAAFVSDNAVYNAFHKNDRLMVVVLYANKTAKRFAFEKSWDELVNHDESFKMHMMYFLKRKYTDRPELENEIHDWFEGYLTEMVAFSNAVDDAVPFTLADLIEAASHMASVYEYRAAKLIGYQVANEEGELPEDFFSFQVIKDKSEAEEILKETIKEEPDKAGMCIYPIYEGDVEDYQLI